MDLGSYVGIPQQWPALMRKELGPINHHRLVYTYNHFFRRLNLGIVVTAVGNPNKNAIGAFGVGKRAFGQTV